MAALNPRAVHYMLARMDQHDLIWRIRRAAEDYDLMLWEMVGLNNFYVIHTAGPITAGRLGINVGEIIGYTQPGWEDDEGHMQYAGGHITGGAFGDLENQIPWQAPPIKDIIGTLRWRYRLSLKQN